MIIRATFNSKNPRFRFTMSNLSIIQKYFYYTSISKYYKIAPHTSLAKRFAKT